MGGRVRVSVRARGKVNLRVRVRVRVSVRARGKVSLRVRVRVRVRFRVRLRVRFRLRLGLRLGLRRGLVRRLRVRVALVGRTCGVVRLLQLGQSATTSTTSAEAWFACGTATHEPFVDATEYVSIQPPWRSAAVCVST